MKTAKFFILLIALAVFPACSAIEPSHNMNPGGHTGEKNIRDAPVNPHDPEDKHTTDNHSAEHSFSEIERPQKIKDMMASRGEQDTANPTLKFIEPTDSATVNGSTIKVRLELGGDLKGYKPMKDPQTQMGNHIHIILDNQPYEAHYNLDTGFELRNVADGEHTLRVFPSRPWHESYKNNGAFQMIRFAVKNGGADATKPVTTNSGQQMSNVNANANTSAAPEGKEMANSKAGAIDMNKPLLTYSRPKGEYKSADAEAVMIDFWLSNAKLADDGGEYRVRYSVDNGEAKFIDKWQPIWESGWVDGKHSIKLELVDKNGNLIDNGGYNSTTREITVTR
jgi:hypothetical protein